MTRKELQKIPGLGALIQSLDERPAPAGSLIPPRHHCTARFAEPGDVWRVIEGTQQTEDQDYSSTNPHCSTVLILKREDELAGEHAVYRAAPVLADIGYCGVQDAIFPREVFGYEAAVACGCEFTLTSKELDRCEGSLPGEWFDRLADFAAWMEADEASSYGEAGTPVGAVEPAFPPLLKTGRPFTHAEDPGYIFHANLAENLQPLMATVLEHVWAEEPEPAPLLEWLRERIGSFQTTILQAFQHFDVSGPQLAPQFDRGASESSGFGAYAGGGSSLLSTDLKVEDKDLGKLFIFPAGPEDFLLTMRAPIECDGLRIAIRLESRSEPLVIHLVVTPPVDHASGKLRMTKAELDELQMGHANIVVEWGNPSNP